MSYLFCWDPVHRFKAKASNLNILWKEAGDSSGKVHGICSLLYTSQGIPSCFLCDSWDACPVAKVAEEVITFLAAQPSLI